MRSGVVGIQTNTHKGAIADRRRISQLSHRTSPLPPPLFFFNYQIFLFNKEYQPKQKKGFLSHHSQTVYKVRQIYQEIPIGIN